MVKISGESISTLLEWEQVHPFVYEAVKAKCIKSEQQQQDSLLSQESDIKGVNLAVNFAVLFGFIAIILATAHSFLWDKV